MAFQRTIFIGVDPSMRHVGLCACWRGSGLKSGYRFDEIQLQGGLDVVLHHMPGEFERFLDGILDWASGGDLDEMRSRVYIVMERQYLRGFGSMWTVPAMTTLLATLVGWRYNRGANVAVKVIWPFPLQLRSFCWDKYRINAKTKRPMIEGASKKLGCKVSSHVADAFFLVQLGRAVVSGLFKINYSKDSNLVIDGGPYGFNHETGFYKQKRRKVTCHHHNGRGTRRGRAAKSIMN